MKDATTQSNSQKLKFLARIEKKLVLLIAALALSWVILAFNSMYGGSSELGVFSSVLFFIALGVVCGMGFYEEDSLMFRGVKGWFTVFIFVAIIGSLLLYLDVFNLLASMLMMTLVVGGLVLVFLLKKLRSNPVKEKSAVEAKEAVEKAQYLKLRGFEIVLSSLLVVIICASFYVLLTSRTQEPMFDVWYTIPVRIFFSLIFLSALTLSCSIFFRRGSSLYLGLIMLECFLFVSVYYLVWYPSLYGDPLSQLGTARYTAKTGAIYARDYLLSNGYWIDIVKYRGYYSIVVLLTRLLNFDIYWVHNVSTPFIWAVVLPFSSYAVTCLLTNKPLRTYPREALLAAFSGFFLFSLLIAWGASPTPNTLGFLFLFFTLPFILRWVTSGGKSNLGFAALGSAAALMTHPLPGVFAAIFLYIAVMFRKVKWMLPKVAAILGPVLLYPLIFGYGKEFELQGLFSIQNFIEFEGTLLTVPLIFAAVGLFLSLRQKNINRSVLSLLLTFYALVVVEYYITQYSASKIWFGASRVLTISDFLLVPFVALCLNSLPEVVAESKRLQEAFASKMPNAKSPIDLKTIVSLALILLISLQSVVTLYQAYPKNEVGLAPTAYEAEAIHFINSTAPRRFVVLSDIFFTNLAIGLLGEDYSYIGLLSGGAFGVSEWDYPIQKLYVDMVNNVRKQSREESFNTLKSALELTYAQTVYFIVSERLPDFEDVILKTSQILQTDRVFGDGRLYVFKYPTPTFKGAGPQVKVIYDDGTTEEVQSECSYTIKSEVTYSIYLKGHRDYNITDYPENWVFQSLTINIMPGTFDNSSDVTSFIFLKGLDPADRVQVIWSANDNYPVGKWKEDSFKEGWGPYPGYKYKISPSINTDGNILTISWNFTKGEVQDYYYAKPVNLLTDDETYVIVRWKSSAAIAVSAFYYPEPGVPESLKGQTIVSLGSYSADWNIAIVKLPPGLTIAYLMVGISNLLDTTISGIQSLYVDYVLISAQT